MSLFSEADSRIVRLFKVLPRETNQCALYSQLSYDLTLCKGLKAMMPYVSLQIVKCRKAREDSKKVKSALLSRFLPFRKAEKGKLMFQFYLKILLFPTNSDWVKIYPWNLWKSSCIRELLLVILHVKLSKSASKALIKKNSEVPWAGFNLLWVIASWTGI